MKTLKIGIFGTFLIGLLSYRPVFAHGEDKPGPHGGFIRMPGAFHTEVIKQNSKLLVYLLDINWKDPTITGFVNASIKRNESESQLNCKALKNNFECDLPKNEKLQSGELIIKSKRGNLPEGTSIYSLPLKLTKPIDDHQNHH